MKTYLLPLFFCIIALGFSACNNSNDDADDPSTTSNDYIQFGDAKLTENTAVNILDMGAEDGLHTMKVMFAANKVSGITNMDDLEYATLTFDLLGDTDLTKYDGVYKSSSTSTFRIVSGNFNYSADDLFDQTYYDGGILTIETLSNGRCSLKFEGTGRNGKVVKAEFTATYR